MYKKLLWLPIILIGQVTLGQTIIPETKIKASSVSKTVFEMQEVQLGGTGSNKTQQRTATTASLTSGEGTTVGQLDVSNMGGVVYTIPIELPPGINGVVPEIALTYNSLSGNGVAGYGWNISGLSVISRIPSTLYHDSDIDAVDLDGSDRFALDGQRLILKSGLYGQEGAVYETENYSNIKIISHGTHPFQGVSGPSYFSVLYPDGSLAVYGNGGNSKSAIDYAINYWTNPQGLKINYEYQRISGTNTNQISEIKYASSNSSSPKNEIEFVYNERRRPEQSFVGGYDLRITNILEEINVKGSGSTFKKYKLDHDITSLHYERLSSVQEFSGNGGASRKPIIFDYENTNSQITKIERHDLFQVDVDQRNSAVVPFDFNGNGKMDFLVYRTTGTNAFKELILFDNIQDSQNNNFGRKFDLGKFTDIFPINWMQPGINKILNHQGLVIVQNVIGGAGTVNFKLAATTTPSSGAFLGLWATKTWNAPTYKISTPCGGNSTQSKIPQKYISGDFDGDGLSDIMALGLPYEFTACPIINPCNCFTIVNNSSSANLIKLDPRLTTNFAFNAGTISDGITEQDRIFTQDFNGNGKTDIWVFRGTKLRIYELDDQNILKLLHTETEYFDNSRNVLIGDFNGDGKTDFMYPKADNSNEFKLFRSTGKNFKFNTKKNPFYYKPTDYDGRGTLKGYNLIPVDINGDGKTDIVQYDTETYNNNTTGKQNIIVYHNTETTSSDILPSFTYATSQTFTGRLEHFPIPVFLNSSQANNNLEFASISGPDLYSFKFSKDHREDTSLKKVTSNGTSTQIKYSRVTKDSYYNYDPYHSYTSDISQIFPYININVAPSFKVVAELQEVGSGFTRYKKFNYKGAISHNQGLGFLGFKELKRTNWYGNGVSKLWTVSKFDPFLRGAVTEQITSSSEFPSSNDFIEKNEYFYDHNLRANPSSSSAPTIPGSLEFNNPVLGSRFDKATQSIVLKKGFTASAANGNYVAKITPSVSDSKGGAGFAGVFDIKATRIKNSNGLTGVVATTNYEYDKFNNTTKETTIFPGGQNSTIVTYSNNPTSTGNTYHIGRPISNKNNKQLKTESFSTEEQYVYDNNLLTEMNVRGNGTGLITETYRHDDFGNVVSKSIDGDGLATRTESYKYDDSGRFVIGSTDIEGLQISAIYDDLTGNVIKQTDPYGLVTNYDYDPQWHYITKAADFLGNEMLYAYDYSEDGSTKIKTQNSNSSDTESSYNAFGWMTKQSEVSLNGQWVHKSFEYDAIGRNVRESEPYFGGPNQWNQTNFNTEGRVESQTLYTGKVISFTYNGLSTTVNDGTKTVTSIMDAVGNTAAVQDPGGNIKFAYYPTGAVKEADYGGHKVSIEIDGWSRKVKLNDPSAGVYTYEYNIFGEPLAETSPQGRTEYTYGDFGEVLTSKVEGQLTNMSSTYEYDAATKLLKKMTGQDNMKSRFYSYTYEYDNYKRPKSIKESNGTANFEKHVTYDPVGRVQTERYVSQNVADNTSSTINLNNSYDANSGILKAVYHNNGSSPIWQVNEINARGQVLKSGLGDGTQKVQTYDTYGFLKTIKDGRPVSGSVSLDLAYSFDPIRGNLNNRNNKRLNHQEGFTYDVMDRLTTISGAAQRTMNYDDYGRITTNSDVGDYAYQGGNRYRLYEVNPTQDAGAYYADHATQQISYNAFKKPIDIKEVGHGRVSFEYGPMMNRTHAYYGGEQEDFYQRRYHKQYSSIIPVEIVEDGQDNTTKFITYIMGDAYSAPIVYIKKTGAAAIDEMHYLHRDHLGSIMAITNSSGSIKEEAQYGAWGSVDKYVVNGAAGIFSHTSLLGRGYTGHEHFFEVGLIHMNGRMYDPKLGRFLSPDNYIQNPLTTQNYNRYGYVLNNPLKYTDPTGEQTSGEGIPGLVQVAIGAAAASAVIFRDAQIGSWLGTNAKSFGEDYSRPYREVGRWIRRLFGEGDKPKSVNYYNNPISSDVAAQSSPNVPSIFSSDGNSVGSQSAIIYNVDFANGVTSVNYERLEKMARLQAKASQLYQELNNGNLSSSGRRSLNLRRGAMLAMSSELAVRDLTAPTDEISVGLNILGVIPPLKFLRYTKLANVSYRTTNLLSRGINASWGKTFFYRHGGQMSAIEHIMYRHGYESGFTNVSRFLDGTSVKTIKSYVDLAIKYGKPIKGGFELNLGTVIGTGINGTPSSTIRIFIKDGYIKTAFPVN